MTGWQLCSSLLRLRFFRPKYFFLGQNTVFPLSEYCFWFLKVGISGDQPVQSHTQSPIRTAMQPHFTCVLEHCPGETGLPSSVFQAVHEMFLTTFPSLELLIQYRFIWKETIQLVSSNVEFNACQVSLLWNTFFVSLWTFQPTLGHDTIFLIFHK